MTIAVNNTLPGMTITTTTSTKIKTKPGSPSSEFNNDETEAANALVSCAFTATILQQKSSSSLSLSSDPIRNESLSKTEKKRTSSDYRSEQPPKKPAPSSSTTTKAITETTNPQTANSPAKFNVPMVNKRPISIVPPISGGGSTSPPNHCHNIISTLPTPNVPPMVNKRPISIVPSTSGEASTSPPHRRHAITSALPTPNVLPPLVNKRQIPIFPPLSEGASTSHQLRSNPRPNITRTAPPPRLATIYLSLPRASVATTPGRVLQMHGTASKGATSTCLRRIRGTAQQLHQQTSGGILYPNSRLHPAGASMSVLPNPRMLHTHKPDSSMATMGLPTPSQAFMTTSSGTTMNSQPEPQQQRLDPQPPAPVDIIVPQPQAPSPSAQAPAPADFIGPQPQKASPAEQKPQHRQQQQCQHQEKFQRTRLREARENYILYKDSSATRKRKTPTTSSDSIVEEGQNKNSIVARKVQRNNNHNAKQTTPSLKSATTKDSSFATALRQQQFTEAFSSCKSTSHRNMIHAQWDLTQSSQRLHQAQDALKEAQRALEDAITTFKQKEQQCEYAARIYASEEFQSFQRITTKRSSDVTTHSNNKKQQGNSGGTCDTNMTCAGLTLSEEDISWWKNYQQLKEYYIQNGHIQLPKEMGPLLAWLNHQREAARTLIKEDLEGKEGCFHREKTEGETKERTSAHPPRAVESSRPTPTCWLLEPHKVVALDDLGIDWDPTTTTWMRRYQELLEYKQRTGHVFIDRDEQFQLWKWMNLQQDLYKRKRLSNSKMKLLEKIGVLWTHRFRSNDLIVTNKSDAEGIKSDDHKKNDYYETENEAWTQEIKTKREQALWSQRYGELTMFKLAHGHCQVPKDFPSNRKLANWVEKQHDFFRRYGLSNSGNSGTPANEEALKGQNKERYQKLLAIGFGGVIQYSPSPSHQQQNPYNPFTPASLPTSTITGAPPQCIYQQQKQKKHQQPQEVAVSQSFSKQQQQQQQQKCLRLSPSPPPPLDEDVATAAGTTLPNRATYWDERFCELVVYKRTKGDCLVPRKTTGGLGEWVDLQRQHYRKLKRGEKTLLDHDQKRRLDEIGFIWDPYTHTWDKRFKELIAYKTKYGNCNVPTHHHRRKNPGYPELSEFVRKQREEYRKLQEGKESLLTQEHITVLEAIGFTWKMHANLPWGERFKQMVSFKEKHGSCKVPKPKSDDEEYAALYKWAKRQRYQYYLFQKGEHSKMTQEQIELLEGIGFSLRPSGKAFERPHVAGFGEQQPTSMLASAIAIHGDDMPMRTGSINGGREIDIAASIPSKEQQQIQGDDFANISSKSTQNIRRKK